MSDRQPLLNVSSRLSIGDNEDDNGNKKQLLGNSFSDWRQCFTRKENDDKYIKLDEDTEHTGKDQVVGILQLFRLSDNIDAVLLSTLPTSISSFQEEVMHMVHWLFITAGVQFLASSTAYFIWVITVKRQISRMSISLFRSLVQRNITYIDTKPTGQLNTKLFENIAKIDKGIGYELLTLVAMIFIVIGALIASFIINWKLTLIMLCLMSLVIGSSFMFSKLIAKEARNELKTYWKAGQIAQEVFSSLRTVLSLNGSKFERKRYERELYTTHWSGIRQGAIFGVFTGWLSLISYLVYTVGFIFGSILMGNNPHHTLTISDILVIVSIFARCMGYFNFVGPFFQSLSEAQGAASAVFQLIDESNDTSINETDVWKENIESIHNINGDVEFDNVNFIYPSRKEAPVLHNLSLIARAGQTTALVGSSGSGKSTCISMLLRYYEPSSGRITIEGRPITDYNVQQLRQNIGIVSQEPILFGTSIYENIRFGKVNATRTEIEQAAQEANAHHFIMQLPDKYETLVGERGIQLSGGEKQRIALARALVKNPTLLLLDEATSALDNVSEKLVQEALDRACKGRTTIVVAHRLTTIQNAHQIYVLDNGSVIEQGTHETLMAKEGGKYQTMVKSQRMEKIDDDKDGILSIQKATEEEEKSIFERSRSLSDSQMVDLNKQTSKSFMHRFVVLRLLSMSSPEWITILIASIACILNGGAQPLFAFLLARIINQFKYCSNSERRHHVLISSLMFLFLGIILFILRFFQYTAFSIAGSKLTQRIRSKAFACLLRQEVAYFDRPENSSGAICVRLSSDASAIKDITGSRFGAICESIALSFFGILFGCLLSWQLTLIVFCAVFIQCTVTYVDMSLRIRLNKQSRQISGQASTLAVEVIHNLRTIKQLPIEKEVLRQYSLLIHDLFISSWKRAVPHSVSYGIFWSLDTCTMAFVYWRALILVENNELTSDHIIMVFSFAIFSLHALRLIGMMSRRLAESVSSAEAFFDLFDRKPAIDNASTEGQELADFRGEIKFDQVKFIYPTRSTSIVLNKFQWNIKPGQRVALVGTSGCGKSTIIQLLERFYDVTSGRILLDGINIRRLNLQWVRSHIGLVSQEPILFDLTIAENIAYGLENVPMEDIINAARRANIHQFIDQLPQGYETKVGLKGSFLSGGEKQRIAIARIILRRPKILLLDEATSAMDSYNEQLVQEALEQAQTEDPSRTSLIIAHRLSTIRSCDSICVLDRGHIVETGTHTELTQRRGAYYKMLLQNNLQ
ncbi:unnamed protein product [Rotaria sordida]|uniref:Uncharacterized protein n=1 Tax=Rotaria sordida TaxID=392033 RepID=A0A814RAL0_9BILA|nr:unnamed protein product [Rotaria sordida]